MYALSYYSSYKMPYLGLGFSSIFSANSTFPVSLNYSTGLFVFLGAHLLLIYLSFTNSPTSSMLDSIVGFESCFGKLLSKYEFDIKFPVLNTI